MATGGPVGGDDKYGLQGTGTTSSPKKIKTRIQIKSDTDENWSQAINFIPLKGELIYYSTSKSFKVGDGETTINKLPFHDDKFSFLDHTHPQLTKWSGLDDVDIFYIIDEVFVNNAAAKITDHSLYLTIPTTASDLKAVAESDVVNYTVSEIASLWASV